MYPSKLFVLAPGEEPIKILNLLSNASFYNVVCYPKEVLSAYTVSIRLAKL